MLWRRKNQSFWHSCSLPDYYIRIQCYTALVEILQAAGIIEPEPPESELERIEDYLMAKPFQPSVIQMAGGKSFRIDRRDQCGFTRNGSVWLRDVDGGGESLLNSDNIVRVRKV
jgi:hypothetical protein